jgi:uncharacterized membrane protein HdeD (DUF308 family)
MLAFLARNWWILVVRGVAAIVFGVLTFLWPGLSLAVLVIVWGAYALADGVIGLFGAFTGPRTDGFPWWLLITAIAGILAGIFTFMSPAITAIALLYLIAAFAIVRGVMTISAAIRLRKEIDNEWLLVLAGTASLLFGVLILLFPGTGALAIVLYIGAAAVVIGVLEIVLGFKMRGRTPSGGAPAAKTAG